MDPRRVTHSHPAPDAAGPTHDPWDPAPVPLPAPDDADLGMPLPEEAQLVVDAIATGATPPGEPLTPLQAVVAQAVVEAMSGHTVDVRSGRAVYPADLAEGFRRRNGIHRTRIFHDLLLCALIRRPLPVEVERRVHAYARALGVDDPMLSVLRHVARGRLGVAMVDFARNGYTAGWSPDAAHALHTSRELHDAWAEAPDDPALAARWRALSDLPEGTLGRAIHQLYESRGFRVPGTPASAPPLLAQHDWVHVLADYGTTVESELEVFAFAGRADDDPKGFALLAMVVGLFETGYLSSAAGLFEADPGHLALDGMAVRLADAMRRGALATDDGAVRKDFFAVDWFANAPVPLEEVRRRFGIVAKSAAAVAAGSVGPWEPGGISPFQLAQGRALAEAEGRPYRSYGASVDASRSRPPTGSGPDHS